MENFSVKLTSCYIALFMEHNPIAMQHYPSDYDPLHSEKSYSTPKLVAENDIIHPLLSRYLPSKFENISF